MSANDPKRTSALDPAFIPHPDLRQAFRCCYDVVLRRGEEGRKNEATRVHHASRRCGGGVAVRGAGAAAGQDADHWVLGANTPAIQSQWTAAFVQRLRELGWIEGRNVSIEYRWAEGRSERHSEIAAEFVRLKVDVIVTAGSAVRRGKAGDVGHPDCIRGWRADPVGSGFVASLARPGGNVTGLSVQATDLAGKRLELLREVAPGPPRFGDHGQC